MTITPAALKALAEGDIGNFLVASTPGGIEAQEAAGQIAMTHSFTTLPKDMDRVVAECFGFVYGADVDDLFVNVTPPDGWTIRPSDHAMWSYVHDQNGVMRGGIFYKAAFYDRRAGGHWDARYVLDRDHDGGHVYTAIKAVDRLTGEVLLIEPVPDGEGSNYKVYSAIEKRISDEMDARFPFWRAPEAYWPRDTDGSPEGPDRNGLDGEAAAAGAEGIAK